MIAKVADAHGWTRAADGRKTVWARIDFHRAESGTAGPPAVPRPRQDNRGANDDR